MHRLRSLTLPHMPLVAAGIVGLLLLWDMPRIASGASVLREGGAVETASAALLALSAIVYCGSPRARRNWHVSAGLILLAMRELDFDKRFTSEGVLQLRLYTGDAAVAEKIAGAAVVGLILVILARLVRHQLRPWLAGLRDRAGWARLFLLVAVGALLAKGLDGLARKLEPLGIDLPVRVQAASAHIEEVLELCLAVGLLALIALVAQKKGRTGDAGTETDRT